MRKLIVAAALFSIMGTGCATILNDADQKINVTTSNNKDVKGTIEGMSFSAPGIISVKRAKGDKIMMVDSSSCNKQTLLTSQVDPKFFINILSGGTFGSSTDYASEKMWKYQDSIMITCN